MRTAEHSGSSEPTAATRVAIYNRVAAHTAQGVCALGAQRTVCEEAAFAHGWQIVTHYADAGWSGTRLHRPALDCLLTQVDDGRIDAVLVSHLNRMSRDPTVLARVIERLRRAGAALFTCTDGRPLFDVGLLFEDYTMGGIGVTRVAAARRPVAPEGR